MVARDNIMNDGQMEETSMSDADEDSSAAGEMLFFQVVLSIQMNKYNALEDVSMSENQKADAETGFYSRYETKDVLGR